jgi:hypothetical protein
MIGLRKTIGSEDWHHCRALAFDYQAQAEKMFLPDLSAF